MHEYSNDYINITTSDIATGILRGVQRCPMVLAEDRGLSVEAAAKRIGVSRSTAWRLVNSGELRCVRPGSRVIIPLSVINEYLAGNSEEAS